MIIRDYVQEKLIELEQGTPILLTTQADEIQVFKQDNPKREEIRTYLLKWGGMQESVLEGFSKDGKFAFPYALGEIFRLDHLTSAWENKPALVHVGRVDDNGLSLMHLQKVPESALVGREAILSGVEEANLTEYKPLLEELL